MPASYTEGLTYTALVYEDPETPSIWIAELSALPEAHSFGRTPEEALAHAKEALDLVLAHLREMGLPLPKDARTVQVGVDAA